MRLCEIHRAYNCQDETCKLMAQADEVLARANATSAAEDPEGFDDLLLKEEPAAAVAVAVEEEAVVEATPEPAQIVETPTVAFEGFEAIAIRNATLGYRVFPVDNLKKKASIKKFPELATCDNLDLIKHWAEKFPDASCGLLATPEGHLFIDEDDSDAFRKGYEAFAGEPYPVSRTTESRPNHRQSHWIQTDYTRAKLKNITQDKTTNSMFSLRFRNYLVLGEGSLHPSGSLYRVVVDSPAVAMPDKLADYILSLLIEKQRTSTEPVQKLVSAVPFQGNAGDAEVPPQFDYMHNECDHGRNNSVSQYAWWVYTNKPREVLEPWVHEYNETHCAPPLDKTEVDAIIKGKLDKPITCGSNSVIVNRAPTVRASAAPATVAAKPVPLPEDVKATSLLIFRTAESAVIAKELGYNSMAAADFNPPLSPTFNRAVIFSNGLDELSQNIYASIPGLGAIYVRMPRHFDWSLANVPVDEASKFLEECFNVDRGIALRSVNARRTKHVELPVDSQIEVTNSQEEELQEAVQESQGLDIVSEMPRSALASSRLGDIFADLLEPAGFPLDMALPALVTAASVLVPRLAPLAGDTIIQADENMVNLYTGLIGKIGAGKSQVIEWATKSLNVFNLPVGPHYFEGKWGSAEAMFKAIKRRQTTFHDSLLLNPDELSHLFAKAGIPNASFASHLTTGFYRRRQNIVISRGVELNIDLALSLIGGIVDDEFGTVLNSATIGGLYDRMLFGEGKPGWQWIHQEYPRPLSNLPLEPAPVAVASDGSVTEVERSWRKEHSGLGRIVEVCIRIAKIYASMDGRPVVTGKDLENLKGLAMRQKTIREVRQPNAGITPDAIFANAVRQWLRANTKKGEYVTVYNLMRGIHSYRLKLGPGVAERCLMSMARGDEIDLWVPKDREGNHNPLPSGYLGGRPRGGLIRLNR